VSLKERTPGERDAYFAGYRAAIEAAATKVLGLDCGDPTCRDRFCATVAWAAEQIRSLSGAAQPRGEPE
jgi:hypothetical protein